MKEVDIGKLQKAIKKGVWWGIGTIFVLVAVVVTIQLSSLGEKVSDLSIRWGWLFLGWILMCSALVALGQRWRILIVDNQQHPPQGLFLTASLCAGLLLNYAIPGPFGELAAAWFVHKRYT